MNEIECVIDKLKMNEIECVINKLIAYSVDAEPPIKVLAESADAIHLLQGMRPCESKTMPCCDAKRLKSESETLWLSDRGREKARAMNQFTEIQS